MKPEALKIYAVDFSHLLTCVFSHFGTDSGTKVQPGTCLAWSPRFPSGERLHSAHQAHQLSAVGGALPCPAPLCAPKTTRTAPLIAGYSWDTAGIQLGLLLQACDPMVQPGHWEGEPGGQWNSY